MKVLVFRHNNQLFTHMREQFDARPENIVAIPVIMDVIGTMVDLDALVSQHCPRYFISIAQLSPNADKLSQKRFRANIEHIERVARKEGVPFIFLSSAMVFDGKKTGL
jgi:dTDP-4-dehydrorhamnose reductase